MSKFNIVIAGSRWIYVGRVHRSEDQLVIEEAYNIRRWGTTAGLGELALEGPKANTVLDWYGRVSVHVLACPGGTIECDDAVWENAAAALSKERQSRKARQ